MKSSRRDRLSDKAAHRCILKNNQNTLDPRFSFTHGTGIASPETVVLFFLGYHFPRFCAVLFFMGDFPAC